MSQYAYSPDTGELIRTDNPAPWMCITAVAPPTFDPATQGCFWRGSAWEVVDATPPVVPIPRIVTMRQARLALLRSGLLTQVNAAVAAADEATKITWEFSSEVQRDNPLVATLVAALGLTEAQLDTLFTLAATL